MTDIQTQGLQIEAIIQALAAVGITVLPVAPAAGRTSDPNADLDAFADAQLERIRQAPPRAFGQDGSSKDSVDLVAKLARERDVLTHRESQMRGLCFQALPSATGGSTLDLVQELAGLFKETLAERDRIAARLKSAQAEIENRKASYAASLTQSTKESGGVGDTLRSILGAVVHAPLIELAERAASKMRGMEAMLKVSSEQNALLHASLDRVLTRSTADTPALSRDIDVVLLPVGMQPDQLETIAKAIYATHGGCIEVQSPAPIFKCTRWFRVLPGGGSFGGSVPDAAS